MQSSAGASSSGAGDDNSPDMLKNTASNIRRLTHEIEQYEGRQKYLAHTRSPSDGGDVRWYFCKTPLRGDELAASVPRTEVVGKGHYFRFCMRDSLAIEASFLQREEDLVSHWWKEYAECSDGPNGKPSTSSKSIQQSRQPSSENPQSHEVTANEEERVGVPVKGGLYEVDLMQRHCFPVYWNGENRRVLRGHWFARKGGLDWLPLRDDVAEQLEYAYRKQVWHRRTFQQSGLFAARVDIQGSTNPGLHALFTGEDDTWEAWLNVDASGFSGVVGSVRNGVKLRRGYAPSQSKKPTQDEIRQQQEEEMDDYCSQVPVRHLVFMVHGIGQRLENSNLVDDVGDFRQLTAALAERHLTSHQRGTQRLLFIPCQWRKGLKLSSEAAVEKCTLDGVRGLRTMLGATVHDVLYYMSPIYCQDIIDSVSNQLNRLYLKFLKRNPGYDGKVSIYAHSLGSVLSYDILCHQENLCSPSPMEWMFKEQKGSRSPTEANIPSGSKHSCDETHKNIETESNSSSSHNSEIETVEGGHDPSGPPAPSDSEESTATYTSDEEIRDASTVDDNTYEPSNGSSFQVESRNTDEVNESNDVKSDSIQRLDEDTTDHEKSEIINSLRRELDILKAKVKEFERVHSEGTSSTTRDLPDSKSIRPDHRDSLKSYTPQIRYTKLGFKVDTFYCVGSPLAVFLSLRNVRIGIGKGGEYWKEEMVSEEMPSCRQMFNIFHPFDPVAYRIEPLICKEFISKRPTTIPYHRGGKRIHVGYQEFKEELAMKSHAMVGHISSVKVKVMTLCESRSNGTGDEESDDANEKGERSYGSVIMERLTGSQEGRVDHSLQDKTFRHAYLSAIGSHTNYWRDPDTALFILRHLYRDIPEEDDEEEEERAAKDENEPIRWSDPRQAADEELPLTFADNMSIKRFSYKVKKVMKNSNSGSR